MRILNESKRDDLLLPYLEVLKQKGINATLGQLKSFMLRKLTDEGGIRNLSLGSNFYLAGAVRYYFNGDLTLNKDLSVFKDDPTAKDTWNEDVCTRLNVLISILRDAYIDTIGQTFEQPEDFGTLSIAKLLRKYNKKIMAVINGEEEEKTEEVYNNNFGHGYSYEILYSYQDARKYYEPTYPGSWCITYGENHYNSYVRNLGIHYVILRKDGWENVKREKGPNWSYRKPQDEYGCSLIALLQSNTNGEPVYITSRWNHGWSSDNSHCEADHAFTKEELMQKTGLTDADLQQMFKEWKTKNAARRGSNKELKKDQLKVVRQLKYAQMKMNGGDFTSVSDVIEVQANFNAKLEDSKINKHLLWCSSSVGAGAKYYFLMDKGKIVFETLSAKDCEIGYSNITEESQYASSFSRHLSANMRYFNNLMLLQYPTYILLYDTRRRQLIDIDGIKKFKAIPSAIKREGFISAFYEVMATGHERALLSLSNNMPLKLPNGSCWYNNVKTSNSRMYRHTICRSNLSPMFITVDSNNGGIIEILYDESSGERYFYDLTQRRFLDITPEYDGKKLTLYTDFNYKDYNVYIEQKNITRDFGWNPREGRSLLLMKGSEIVNIGGHTEFKEMKSLGSGIIGIIPLTEENRWHQSWNPPLTLYDLERDEPLINPENGEVFEGYRTRTGQDERFMFIFKTGERGWTEDTSEFIFDKENRSFIENPVSVPSKYQFYLDSRGSSDGSGIVAAKIPNAPSRYADAANTRYYFLLNIPGVDNSFYMGLENDWWRGITVLPASEPAPVAIGVNDIENMVNEVALRILEQFL